MIDREEVIKQLTMLKNQMRLNFSKSKSRSCAVRMAVSRKDGQALTEAIKMLEER